MSAAPVLHSIEGRVGIIELARPEKFNCMSLAAQRGIKAALDEFETDGSGVRAVLIRAAGKNFCVGADLEEVKGLRGDRAGLSEFIRFGHDVLRRLEASPLPVVAAVQGLCLAGGIELMLACDVVLAGADARMGDQHAQFGLIPGWGGSQRLPRVVGLRRAMDLFFSARWIDAETALQWGLVNQVCPNETLVATAQAYCDTLAERSRSGLAAMKRLAREGADLPLDAALQLEVDVAVDALMHVDVTEGLAAFEARRKPVFS